MFCPKCKSEYRQGFYVCADCNADLVEELPPQVKPDYIEYVELAELYNPAEISLIKSILDAEGITYYFNPENYLYVGLPDIAAKLMVKTDESEKAKEILARLNS
jgi:hypothetical protein